MTDRMEDARRPVLIIGAGRAGRPLAAALAHSGLAVRLHGRRPLEHAEQHPEQHPEHKASGGRGVQAGSVAHSHDAAGALPADLAQAGVVILAVRDDQLDGVIGALAGEASDGRMAEGAVVLQLSGSDEPASLARLRAAGRPVGTFHPLLPLTPESAPAVFRGAWVGIDGDPAAMEVAGSLAARIGAHSLRIPAGARASYHAAAVLASNFPVVLAALAARLLREAGVEPTSADGAVGALLSTAAANVERGPLDPAAVASRLTGPISRGDGDTLAAHREALAGDATTLAVYDSLSRAAVEVLRAGGFDPSRLAAIVPLLPR